MQWGVTSHSSSQYATATITFPLTFSTAYSCVVVPKTPVTSNTSCTVGVGVSSLSNSQAKAFFTGGWGGHNSNGSYWCSFGTQQWGLAPTQHNSGYATDTIKFNISFTSSPIVVFNTCDSTGNAYGYSLVSPTTTQFGAYKGIYQTSWIAVGY